MKMFRPTTPTVDEAERQLADARAAEAAAAERRAAADRDRAAALAQLERDSKGRVAALERLVSEALAAVPDDGRRPDLGARRIARGYLRGLLRPPELRRPESMVADVDECAAVLLDAVDHCAGVLDHLTRATSVRLPGDHPLVARADDCEAMAWSAFVARVKAVAGEAS